MIKRLITTLRRDSLLGIELALCYRALARARWGGEKVRSDQVREGGAAWAKVVGKEGKLRLAFVDEVKATGYKTRRRPAV